MRRTSSCAGSRVSRDSPLVFLVAGEPSGDLIGARLMAALKDQTAGRAKFAGVGGERMIAEGLIGLFPMADLSVMGLTAVARRAPLLIRRLHQTAADALNLRPDAIITIDSPGFNVRLGRRLEDRQCPLIHYVAPMVWAWRAGRARTLARVFDQLLALFPFEPSLFEPVGLRATFVGHPLVEEPIRAGDGKGLRVAHGIPAAATIIVALPGSRADEVSRLLPVFGAALGLLLDRHPKLHAFVPTVAAVADLVADGIAAWPVPARIVRGAIDRYAAFASADAALAASGSVVLELAAAGVPTVVGYRTSLGTAFIGRRLIRIPHVSLVNILAGEAVMPEFLQEHCRPEALADALDRILTDPAARTRQQDTARDVMAKLGLGQAITPSARAARIVLAAIATRRSGSVPATSG
ncbi:MAG: lipid-A-disaccharide synthase [Alphaproteobacteria bacterium]|nr:lipid-A-disaccharide synthase [Alphaproteobacteria bacterium]